MSQNIDYSKGIYDARQLLSLIHISEPTRH